MYQAGHVHYRALSREPLAQRLQLEAESAILENFVRTINAGALRGVNAVLLALPFERSRH